MKRRGKLYVFFFTITMAISMRIIVMSNYTRSAIIVGITLNVLFGIIWNAIMNYIEEKNSKDASIKK